ncbi:MAG: glycosyltransferase [Candidatus Eisenbacteria bacterium]
MPPERARPLLVCASTQYWDETWFRKQHFMSRLAKRRPVLYVEPSRSILRPPPPDTRESLRNPLLRARTRLVENAVQLWTPPRGLPFWTHPAVSRAQYAQWGRALRASVERLGFSRVWLWLVQPLWIQAREALGAERVILDLVDDVTAYEARAHSRATMSRCVDRALEAADLIVTTTRPLAESARDRNPAARIEVVGNGVRQSWIDRAPGAVPRDLASLPRPWIGFAGAIFTYLDFEILAEVARALPEASLVLLGPIHETARAQELARAANVHLLGARPQEEVPDYLAAFDLCLSPFKAGAVRRAVNPLKIYEYLAAGRPVVSTPLESLRDEPIAREIRFAEAASDFVAAVRATLAEESGEGSEARAVARRAAVRPYTWEALSERVESILDEMETIW